MLTKTFTINSSVGLHARPAAVLVSLVKTFKSSCTIKYQAKTAVLSSLLSILTLGVESGNSVEITVSGPDEAEAMARLEKFFEEELPNL